MIKKILILAVPIFFIAAPCFAAISFDAVSYAGNNMSLSAGTTTWNHTVSGSNPFLFVSVNNYGPTTDCVNSVQTFGGGATTTLTRINTQVDTGGADRVTTYGLMNPATGTNNVSVHITCSATYDMWAASYDGVDTSQSVASLNQNTGGTTASTISVSVTTPANGWLVGSYRADGGTQSAGSGTYLRSNVGDGGAIGLYDSNADLSAGSNSLNVSAGGSLDLVLNVVALPPFVSGGGGGSSSTASTSTTTLYDNDIFNHIIFDIIWGLAAGCFIAFLWVIFK